MADGNASRNNRMLYFIVGALCIVVGAEHFILGGTPPGQKTAQTMQIKVEVPKVEKKQPGETQFGSITYEAAK